MHSAARRSLVSIIMLFGLAAGPGSAAKALAEISVAVEPGYGTIDDTFTLSVTVSGHRANTLSNPDFPDNREFAVRRTGTTTKQSIVNGKARFAISFNFAVYPNQSLEPGSYELPAGTMSVGGRTIELERPRIKILPRSAQLRTSPETPVRVSHSVDTADPFVGQQVTYRVKIVANDAFVGGQLVELEPKGYLEESFGTEEKRSRNAGNNRITTFSKVVIPTQPGKLLLPSRTVQAKLRTRERRPAHMRSFFDRFPLGPLDGFTGTVNRSFTTAPLQLNVRPLPDPPQGWSGYIPTGKLSLRTDIDHQTIKEGESVTLTLTVSGRGNLRPFDMPEPEEDEVGSPFKRYDDRPVLTTQVKGSKIIYRKVFKTAFVPRKSGTFDLPRFTVPYFDPSTETYRFLKSDRKTITVQQNEKEQLQIRGAGKQAGQNAVEGAGKEEIELLGEGLLPQREGRRLFEQPKRLPKPLLLAVLIAAPLLAGGSSLLLSRRRLLEADPLRRKQLTARKRALEALDRPEPLSAEVLHGILTRFVGDRLRVRGESLTAEEAKRLVLERSRCAEAAGELKSLLDRLQNEIYSGKSNAVSVNPAYRDSARALIHQIDRESPQI